MTEKEQQIINEVGALTPEQVSEELLKLRARQRQAQLAQQSTTPPPESGKLAWGSLTKEQREVVIREYVYGYEDCDFIETMKDNLLYANGEDDYKLQAYPVTLEEVKDWWDNLDDVDYQLGVFGVAS